MCSGAGDLTAHRQTDRVTDRKPNRETDGQEAMRQTDRPMLRPEAEVATKQTDRKPASQTDSQTGSQPVIHTDRQTDRPNLILT